VVLEHSAPALSSRGSAVRCRKIVGLVGRNAWRQPMPSPVFLSYSRTESAATAQALHAKSVDCCSPPATAAGGYPGGHLVLARKMF